MVDRPFLESRNWQEQQWRAVRAGAHWDILEFEKVFIKAAARMGIPMFAHNMVRTSAEQTELYIRGVSRAKAGQSPHNFGCAVDIVHSLKAWDLSKFEWQLLGHIGKEHAARRGLKVTWGGDWRSFYDPAHWQITGWRQVLTYFPFPAVPKGPHRRWRASD